MKILTFTFCLILLSTGCLPLHRKAIEGRFTGLRSLLQDSSKQAQTLHLLIVHGMGIHSPGYSHVLVGELASELKLEKVSETPPPGVPLGSLRETVYSGQGRKLRAYELTWSPATEWIKWSAFWHDIAQRRDRQLVNQSLKENLVDLSLSDAVLYAGSYRAQMQKPVRFAIEHLQKQLGPEDHVAIITMSLGSYILFDTLESMAERAADVQTRLSMQLLAERTTMIFMLANQLPLLRLSELREPAQGSFEKSALEKAFPEPDVLPNPLKQFIERRQKNQTKSYRERSAELLPLQIVALTDPNDLLSYKLRPRDVHGHPFANVTLSVAKWSLLGIAANPYEAHTRWPKDRRAIQLIIQGHGPFP